ncbi:hypothetical protein BX070DRAFT_228978 [Coemansia spiralis]|nr:hypothetical protein BX070DRAFT_228978 [Coemansia spiralis]
MSAGYMFEPYARDTFQMALKLFLTDSHTVPLFASAQWLRGKEHAPSSSFDCAGRERVLPLRTATDLHMWARQAAEHSGIGNIVAVGHDAAVTHPNSTTHHGHADASELVCSCDDLDAFDARAALGHLVSSLVLVFGPELQADHTRDSVLTLLHELRRALPLGILVPSELSPIADPDARWQTVAEFIFATQKQLLFLHCGAEFVPLFLRQTLRPIVRAQEITYHGQAGGLHRLQRVAVQAMEGALRLYGGRILAALRENAGAYWADWSLCDIVWEALVLYNTVSDQLGSDDSALLRDLRKLVQTAIGLTIGHELAQLEALCARGVQFGETGENAEGIQGILAMVETLCLVFLTRRAVPTLVGLAGHEAKAAPADVLGARPFNAATKRLVVAALVAHLDAVGPLAHSQHPLTSMLADLLRVGYIAATSDQPTLCCLGLFLLQLLIEQLGHIEDPKTHDAPILVIYEAQLNTAFMPLLSSTEPVVRRAAMNTATAYVVSGLISDRSTFVRILRLMAPQPIGKKKDTEQIKIVMRLTVLREWSVIFSFALRTHNDALMDIVNLHMPALCKMWLAAVHDTAAVTMEQASVGLELGLDAAYVGLVRERLATWYRYYLPQFLFTLSSLLTPLSVENSTKKTKQVLGHAEVLRLLDSPSCKDTKSVLLFAFALQELSAMATKDYQEPRDPFVQTVLQIGPLDLDTSFGEGKRATLYCAPGQLSHVDRIESLQRLLCALLEPPLYSKVESVLLSTSGNSWLIEAVWTHAVSKFMRMTTPVATTLDLAQGVLRHCVLVDHVQSGPRFLDGLSGFGKTVVRDIVDAWQACCSLLESGGSMANTLVAKCLDLLGTVVCASLLRTDGSSKHSLSLWLTLWHKSLFLLGEPRVAAESLGCFMRKLVGDQADVANCMVNALLVQLLSAPSEENGHAADSTTIRALSIVAWLASQDNTALEPIVSAELSSRFVSVFEAQLRAACKAALAQDSHVNTLVSTIKPVLASRTNSILTELLPRLARSSIPLLATRLHNNNNSNNSSSSNSNSEEPVLSVLCMFATAHYASAQQSTGVMAAVLMLFLSMLLPQEADLVGAKEKKNVVAKAILSMASVAPERFKPIVVRLSATQPEAKRRLELAIRSQTTHGVEHVESLDDTSKGAEPDTASKIVLKSSFGF